MRRVAVLVLGFGVGAGLYACTLANPNHCFNLAIDTNAWCAAVDSTKPYCSPCEHSDNNWGCVAKEPTDCPYYTAPATETGSDSGTDTSGTDTSGTDTSGTDTSGTGG